MKTKTETTVMCSLTDEPIGAKPAIVLQGRLLKLQPDGSAGDVVLESADGDAFLLSAFFDKVRKVIAPPKERKPQTKVEPVPEDKLLKAIKQAGGTIALAKLNEAGPSPFAVKKGLDLALAAGTIVRHAKGVYGVPAQAKK